MWHYGRALAYAGKRQFEDARREQPEFEKLRKELDRNMPWDTNKLGDVLDLASAALAARLESTPALAVPNGNRPWRCRMHWRTMNAGVVLPDSRVAGRGHAFVGDTAGAETVFREGLQRSPNNGRMLFGLLESLKAAAQERRDCVGSARFEAAWKGADVELRIADL